MKINLKMEGLLQESKTIPSISYVDRYFSSLPSDARFGSVIWNRIVPVNGSGRELKTFSFVLPKMDPPNVYLVMTIKPHKLWFKINIKLFTFIFQVKNIYLKFYLQLSNVMLSATITIMKPNRTDLPDRVALVGPGIYLILY